MANDGWIKLHRKIFENEYYFSDKFTRSQAWIDLLLLANHKEKSFFVRGIKVVINRGEIGYGIEKLAERWTWSRGKVERFLNDLENSKQIVRQKNNVTTTISISNYSNYQGDDKANSKADSKADSNTDSKANSKADGHKQECKEDKKYIYADFISAINRLGKRSFKGDAKSKSKFEQRLNEGFTESDFEMAIKNAYADPFHIENNFKYLTPEFFSRPDKIDNFMNRGNIAKEGIVVPEELKNFYQVPPCEI